MLAAPAAARHTHPTPTPSPTPVPPADPAVTALARRAFVLAQAGQLDKKIMTPEFRENSTDQVLAQNSEQLGTLGALTNMLYLGPLQVAGLPAGVHAYLYKMLCSNGSIYEQLYVGAGDKIEGEVFRDTLATPTPGSTDTPIETATP